MKPRHASTLGRAAPGLLALLLLASVARAQLLARLDTDARSAGMGGAGVATADGPTSGSINPALLGSQEDMVFHLSLPIQMVSPAFTSTLTLREMAAVTPLPFLPRWRPVAGLQFRRLFVGPIRTAYEPEGSSLYDDADESYGLSLAVRPLDRLCLGMTVRWVALALEDAHALSFDLGVLGRHRFLERGDARLEGRAGLALRRAGEGFVFAGDNVREIQEPQAQELAGGLALLLQAKESRLTLSADLVDPIYAGSADRDRHFDRFFGAELQMLTVCARLGHRDEELQRQDNYGFGVLLPFPHGVSLRADYAKLPMSMGVRDLYSLSLGYRARDVDPPLLAGRRLRGRVAAGLVGAANSPDDLYFRPGPAVQLSSLVELSRGLELETWVGWAWLDASKKASADWEDSHWSYAQLGSGLRRTIELGAVRPWFSGGVGGFRLGRSFGDDPVGREQTIRPGYALGIGVELPAVVDEKVGLDLGLRITGHDGWTYPDWTGLHWELGVGVLFE